MTVTTCEVAHSYHATTAMESDADHITDGDPAKRQQP